MKALIFGATGAVGSSLAEMLVVQGHQVFLTARKKDRLKSLANQHSCGFLAADVCEKNAIDRVLEKAQMDLGGSPDAIAFCVGSTILKPAHLTSDEEWQEVMNTNLFSAFRCVKSAVKTMMKAGGSVVLVSSAAARTGLANHEAIACAKAGVIGLTLSAASTYASKNIRINAVAPGMVESSMTQSLLNNSSTRSMSESLHPLGRIGSGKDVASLIAWLLQPQNSWMTGQVIGIDGGLASLRPRQLIRSK